MNQMQTSERFEPPTEKVAWADGEAICPVGLQPTDRLSMPLRKRLVVQRLQGEGGEELHLFHGRSQVIFDDPDMFGFGEALGRQDFFRADEALAWAGIADWPKVCQLLESLIDAGLIRRADEVHEDNEPKDRARPSPLAPARYETPRFWTDCRAIMQDLAGLDIEDGHLEQVVPIFRVLHPALDADGRQVGEANVFPRALRLDRPTRWMTCIYSGTRYLVDNPMNLTALQAMRQYWPQMMASLLAIRSRFLDMFPQARAGLTIGLAEKLCVIVLAVPTWQMVKPEGRVANGDLHPALSSLFRVTDGLRTALHQMLFVPLGEPMLPPDTPVTVAMVHAYAERNFAFHSETGVCAGPKLMVEEFLSVILNGHVPASVNRTTLDDAVIVALADMDAAFSYGLAGLRTFAAIFTTWPEMAECYQALAGACHAMGAGEQTRHAALLDRLDHCAALLEASTYLADSGWRSLRLAAFDDMYSGCGVAASRDGRSLADRLVAAGPDLFDLAVRIKLHLSGRLDDDAAMDTIAAPIARFLGHLQAVLRISWEDQSRINTMAGRAEPSIPFGARELDAHNRLQVSDRARLPFLLDELPTLFGFAAEVDGQSITIRSLKTDGVQPGMSPGSNPASSPTHTKETTP